MQSSPPAVATQKTRYSTSDLEDLKGLTNYHSWIYQEIQPFLGLRLAEVGSGLGTFSKVLIDKHLASCSASIAVYEPAQNLFPHLKDFLDGQYPDLIKSKKVIFSNSEFSSRPQEYDTIILINVLEHIKNDTAFLQEARESLIKSGRLILFVPALTWLYSEFDREVGHCRRYTRETLSQLMKQEGFEIIKSIYMDFLGILPWYIVNVIGKSKSINPKLAKIYDTVGIPLTKTMEKLLPPKIGKNILIIGQKPKK